MPAKPEFDCVPIEGEPHFTLLARDPQFTDLINTWIKRREADMYCGLLPQEDFAKVTNAKIIASSGADWRRKNNGAWRQAPTTTVQEIGKDGVSVTSGVGYKEPLPTKPILPVYDAIRAAIKPSMTVPAPAVPMDVYDAIRAASLKVDSSGGQLPTMLAFAKIESNFRPTAQATGGSAAGLYQFTHATWTEMVNSFGARHKITPDMVLEPLANATMMAERIKQYTDYLRVKQVFADTGNMYCLHFLGMTGGYNLILDAEGNKAAGSERASAVFPIAAAANPSTFGDLTIKSLYNKLHDMAQELSRAYLMLPFKIDGRDLHGNPVQSTVVLDIDKGNSHV